jgi:hypothetical protein
VPFHSHQEAEEVAAEEVVAALRDTAAGSASASVEVPVADQVEAAEAAEAAGVAADAPSASTPVVAVAAAHPSSPGTTRDHRLRAEEEPRARVAREEGVLAVAAAAVVLADCSASVRADRLQRKDQSPLRRDAPWSCTPVAERTASSRR